MDSYTYSNARKNLSQVLNLAAKQGQVKITRRDGKTFIIRPETRKRSPLDVKGVNIKGLTMSDVLDSIKDGRKNY
jgi:hypothetical protein